jgi:protocatechuate 3,4-dioxygenase beta subunit
MDTDDSPIGRVLTRREALTLLGGSGVALFFGPSLLERLPRPIRPLHAAGWLNPGCVARPEQTEGPYFVDERLKRADIRSDPSNGKTMPGTPLLLGLTVASIVGGACRPIAGAQVDIWHCDAEGVYSDVTDPHFRTVGQRFLRGYQVTDARGTVRFTTIYPGWYPGRTVHIHFKVRTDPASERGHAFTSQLYFDDAFSDRVFARAPYAGRGERKMRNADDEIFQEGGRELILAPKGKGEGYAADFTLGLDLS